MKIFTSYYYQVRNFYPWMIPIGTSITLPKWFYNKDYHQYIDKRGVLNGVRCKDLAMPKEYYYNHPEIQCGGRSCDHNPGTCKFLQEYYEYLTICLDFGDFLQRAETCANRIKNAYKIKHEIYLVLVFFETPQNLCSERNAVQKWFKENGYNLTELKYPINTNYGD